MPRPTQDQLEEWVEAIETRGFNLTTWEAGFIESMRNRIDAGRTFTDEQAQKIEEIYAERTP